MRKRGIKIWELALLLALCISLCEAAVHAERAEHIADNVLRFHVIAASDEPEDQALKLRVRDAVLPAVEDMLDGAVSSAEAAERINAGRDELLAAARQAAEGQQVELLLGRESYDRRSTESYVLPAGDYTSLRIVIGAGEGHNWWGVIFPQLDAAGGYAEAMNALDEEELRLIYDEDGVIVRFRFLELLEEFCGLFR